MRSILRVAVPLCLLTAVSACKSGPKQPPPPKVQAVSAQMAAFTEGVDTVSTLEASNLVELAAQAGGRIEALKIRQGDTVQAGQLLVVLDQAQVQARLAEDRYKMETAKLNWQRYEFLARQGASSLKQRDQYRTQYLSWVEKVKSTEATVGYNNLRSPIAGTVADVKVKLGDVLQKGQVFTSLVQNNALEARIEVPAVYAERLALGQPVLLSAPGSAVVMATGEVDSIDPRVNPKTQGLLVRAVFANNEGKLRDGLRLRTRVQLQAQQALSVPFAAVTQTSGQSFVYRLGSLSELKANPGKADLDRIEKGIKHGKLPANAQFALQTPVSVGELEDGRYPIAKGLELNQKVITTNLLNLKHGMPVQVQPAQAN